MCTCDVYMDIQESILCDVYRGIQEVILWVHVMYIGVYMRVYCGYMRCT